MASALRTDVELWRLPAVGQIVRSRAFCAAALSLWCGFLFFYGLNAGELWRTEGLRAIIAQEMLRSGNWIVPMLYGEPLFTKPPGMYAAIALVSWPFGGVTEWTARLPSALAATATVLLFFWYFARQFGRGVGLCAALILPMSPMWLDKASAAEIDMLHVFWVTAAILFFLTAIEASGGHAHRRDQPGGSHAFFWITALLCVAAGTLTKWTAPVFFYLTAVPLLWQRKQLRLLTSWGHMLGAILAASICLGWVALAVSLAGWDSFYLTVKREALYRLVPNYAEDPYRWDETLLHPLRILITTLPFSLLALWTLRPGFASLWDERGRRVLEAMHCWLWPNLLFFSLLTEHTPRHSFPFFPAIAGLAVMAGLAFQRGLLPWRRRMSPLKILLIVAAIWLVLKLAFVEVLTPKRNAHRNPHAKGALLASLVPVDAILYLFDLKDEGIMFYFNRPLRRLSSPAQLPDQYRNVYCILKENEYRDWPSERELQVLQRLQDQQGDAIVLVRVGKRSTAK